MQEGLWHPSMGQHPDGVRQAVEGHMCPECGVFVKPLCPVCLGFGSISTERLDRWQYEQNRNVNKGVA